MKIQSLASVLLLGTFGLSACHMKTGDDYQKEIDHIVEDNKKKTDEMLKDLDKRTTGGGQPGKIELSGVIVKSDLSLDSRIQVLVKGGVGKDGKEAILADTSKPALSAEAKPFSKKYEEETYFAIGCGKEVLDEQILMRSLEVEAKPKEVAAGIVSIEANTIILCGKVSPVGGTQVTFSANELVLIDADYTQIGFLYPILTFETNFLTFMGQNKISTIAVASSISSGIVGPSLKIHVVKEIEAHNDSRLVIESIGSNYKEEPKK